MTTWLEELAAARARLSEVGYGGLTAREQVVLAFLHTSTANVAIPRDLDPEDRQS